jgi:hypothetical protein
MALAPLRLYFRPQDTRFKFVSSYPGNPLLPETDIDAGSVAQHRRQIAVVFARDQSQVKQGIVPVGFDLGSEHAGRCLPSLAKGPPRLDDEHASSRGGQLACAGRPDGSAADHHHIVSRFQGYRMKLFETSWRTAA